MLLNILSTNYIHVLIVIETKFSELSDHCPIYLALEI